MSKKDGREVKQVNLHLYYDGFEPRYIQIIKLYLLKLVKNKRTIITFENYVWAWV
jgi:hypothetical protein